MPDAQAESAVYQNGYKAGQRNVLSLLQAELRKVTQGGGAVQITATPNLRGMPKYLADMVERIESKCQ